MISPPPSTSLHGPCNQQSFFTSSFSATFPHFNKYYLFLPNKKNEILTLDGASIYIPRKKTAHDPYLN
jgi:hypothetical protein